MLKPLDKVEDLIDLIAQVTDVPAERVHQRLRNEADEIGSNVSQAIREQNIPMYQMSEQLEQFYRDDDAFVYDSAVWNTCDAKQDMRDFIQTHLETHFPDKASVFCFGDGLGFDSTWLAMKGHDVLYSEPSVRCRAFAHEVFRRNQVTVGELDSIDDIQPESLDAVVCLDVLEHVPQPEQFVRQFRRWLKPDGLLFVHAPFWFLHWTRPTHLAENRRLSGDLRNLYHAVGFTEVDALLFWNPIVLQRADRPNPLTPSVAARMRIQVGRHLLRAGRWNSTIHSAIARFIARPPGSWKAALK